MPARPRPPPRAGRPVPEHGAAWWVDVGSPRLASWLAGGTWLLAAPSAAGLLPGTVHDIGGGWLAFSDCTLASLRVRRVVDDGDVQILTGPGGERWPIWPAGHDLAVILERARDGKPPGKALG